MADDRKRGKAGGKPGYLMPNFRAIRLELGLDQGQAAERIGVWRGTIIQWEKYRNGVSRERLEQITAALGVTVADLIGKELRPLEEPPRRPQPPPPVEELPWAGGKPGPRGIPLPGLREVRQRLGMSQLVFAHRVGLSEHTVASLENGKHGAHRRSIAKIAERLGIDADELMKLPTG